MKNITNIASGATCSLLFLCSGNLLAQTVYSTDFTGTVIGNKSNPYIGGYYGDKLSFGKFTGDTALMKIIGGQLSTYSSSNIRSAGVVLSPSTFAATGAGDYVLSFDIASFSIENGIGSVADKALVTVWQGSGYNLTGSANALVVDTYKAILSPLGTATASQSAAQTYTSTGTKTINFNYDGVSAVAIFLGSQSDGYPHLTTVYDNLTVSKITTVPEPSSLLLVSLASLALLRRKRN